MNVQPKKAPQRRESDRLNEIIERGAAVFVMIVFGTPIATGIAVLGLLAFNQFAGYGG